MKLAISEAALLFLTVASPVAAWKHTTESDFRKALQNSYALVAFVEPSLEGGKALESEWLEVQRTTKDSKIISIDCSAETKLCDEYDVASYPAIRLLQSDGQTRRFRGSRRASDIVSFFRRSLRPTLSYVDDKNITSFVAIDDIVFVANYAAARDDGLADRFAALARTHGDRYSFAVGPVLDRQGAASSIRCYNTPEDEQHTGTDFTAVAALDDFVQLCTAPAVIELTRRNELQVLNAGKSLVHYFYNTEKERRAYVDEMRPLAKKYREYLAFTTVDAREYGDMLGSLGLVAGDRVGSKPLAVQNPNNGDVFPYRGKHDISLPVVEAFLVDIIQGTVKPWTGAAGAAHDEL